MVAGRCSRQTLEFQAHRDCYPVLSGCSLQIALLTRRNRTYYARLRLEVKIQRGVDVPSLEGISLTLAQRA